MVKSLLVPFNKSLSPYDKVTISTKVAITLKTNYLKKTKRRR